MLITQRCLDNDALATVKKIRLYTLEKYVKQIYFLIFLSRLRRACATGTGAGVFKIWKKQYEQVSLAVNSSESINLNHLHNPAMT